MTTSPADDPSTPVLFLSGSGLPAWIWDDVRRDLPAGTATVVARYPRGGTASLADYADTAAAQASWARFAVVAHSSGGVVATELLARHRDRVSGVLAVSAVVPSPGHSFVGSMPFPARLVLGAVVRLVGTRPPAKTLRSGLAHGLPEAVADRIVAEFDPESVRFFRDVTSPRTWPAARAYLHTGADKELTPAIQRAAARALDAAWTVELATGHLPMLEDPGGVSHTIRRLLTDVTGRPETPRRTAWSTAEAAPT